MPLTTFPLASGENDSVDSKLLPDGLVRRAENVVLQRDGRMSIRPAFSALGTTTYGTGTFVGYDLAEYRGRVVALGDRLGLGLPTDVFELQPDGSARAWRPSDPDGAYPRLPLLHSPRLLAQQVDQQGGVDEFQQAVSSTHLGVVFQTAAMSYVHIVRRDTDQTVLFQALDATDDPVDVLHIVAVSTGEFCVVGAKGDGSEVTMVTFDPASDVALSSPVVLFTGSGVSTVSAVASGSNLVVSTGRADGNTSTALFDTAGSVQQAMGTIVGNNALLDISAPDPNGRLAVVSSSSGITVSTLDIATGTVTAGPTSFAAVSGLTVVNAGAMSDSTNQVMVSVSTSEGPSVTAQTYLLVTGAFTGSPTEYPDITMTALPALLRTSSFFTFGAVSGTGGGEENGVSSSAYYQARLGNASSLAPVAAMDFGTAESPSAIPPTVVFDGTEFFYPRLAVNEDGLASGTVLSMNRTVSRRQTATVGGALYIAGGTVCRYGGRCLTETQFHERPRIISLTPSNGAGALLSGAEYDYRLHWEWVDELEEVTKSAVSEIFTVSMGASDDTVTLVCSTPHSLRVSDGATELGASVRVVLYRTAATATLTPPTMTGANVLDLSESDFSGLQIGFLFEDSAGSSSLTYTFGSNPASLTAMVSELNGDTGATASGRAVYGQNGSRLTVSLVEGGEDNYIAIPVLGTPGGTLAGFFGAQTQFGTTERTKGTNFHRTAIGYIPAAADPGDTLSVVDTRADQSDPIDTDTDLIAQGIVYTQSNSTGSDVSPLPSSYIAAGHDRMLASGHPDPSLWTVSKLHQRSGALAFADENLLSFSGQIPGDVLAVYQFGEVMLLWTESELYAVQGQGPSLNGQGEFFAPRRIPTDGGMKDGGWRSLVETAAGLFFQLDDDKIYLLTRALKLEWVSHAARRRLEEYPEVTAAAHSRATQEVVFSVTNAAGDEGGHLRFDIRTGQWLFDTVGPTDALVAVDGRVHALVGGVVQRQDLTAGEGSVVVAVVETGDFQGFSRLGYGQLQQVAILGSWRGNCSCLVEVSYDSGLNWAQLILASLQDTEYTADQAVRLQASPAIQMVESFRIRITVTPEASSAGIDLHAIALQTTKSPGVERAADIHRS